MFVQKLAGCTAAAALAVFLPIGATQAAMSPAVHYGVSNIQHVDCAVGFHLGPVGTCVLGVDNPPPPVVVERPVDPPGCETKSVKRTNGEGDSVTRTTTNCD